MRAALAPVGDGCRMLRRLGEFASQQVPPIESTTSTASRRVAAQHEQSTRPKPQHRPMPYRGCMAVDAEADPHLQDPSCGLRM